MFVCLVCLACRAASLRRACLRAYMPAACPAAVATLTYESPALPSQVLDIFVSCCPLTGTSGHRTIFSLT